MVRSLFSPFAFASGPLELEVLSRTGRTGTRRLCCGGGPLCVVFRSRPSEYVCPVSRGTGNASRNWADVEYFTMHADGRHHVLAGNYLLGLDAYVFRSDATRCFEFLVCVPDPTTGHTTGFRTLIFYHSRKGRVVLALLPPFPALPCEGDKLTAANTTKLPPVTSLWSTGRRGRRAARRPRRRFWTGHIFRPRTQSAAAAGELFFPSCPVHTRNHSSRPPR